MKLLRPIALCIVLTAPALALRLGEVEAPALLGLLLFGAAVVAASFLLAWASRCSSSSPGRQPATSSAPSTPPSRPVR
ncbi:hypothetical protein KZZ52_15640 [Dactylosporangium sp. AC04546]|uniref:hypothetical protein n=1 Tax=Dactylosporangium sp. AC04546 TaxID=2862460 RepID=UPI001EE10982|nr:hypothetical protein [Dactylosporangium sp. AC04546]WVK86739.1 hypothetical protein KZZ52_15640 [Dactylosporangium sp. AC04546]